MEVTQDQCQGASHLTINDLPHELLIEIFDLCRQNYADINQSWSVELKWFKLIHVCKRWRTIMFASSFRLDLCFVLKPKMGGNMKTIMSHHFPPLPIDIKYYDTFSLAAKDMSRALTALKRPHRVRRIAFTGSMAELAKLFKAAKCSLPALESLELRDSGHAQLNIPATFLKGSNLKLRTLKLTHVSLPSISRLLSSAPALTCLALADFINNDRQLVILPLLSHLRDLPCLRHFELYISRCMQNPAPTNPEDNFRLSNLTSFHYGGYTAHLYTVVAGFVSPSLREVDIFLYDRTLPPITHIPRFIDDMEESYYSAKFVLERDYFHFSLVGRHSDLSEGDGDQVDQHSPQFRLHSEMLPGSIMHISNAFSAKLAVVQELIVISTDPPHGFEDIIPWRRFSLQFRSVKTIRLEGTNNRRIASALDEDNGELNSAFFPALKEIELCTKSSFFYNTNPYPSELLAFEPFVSARQQAGLPVDVFWGRSLLLSSR